MSWPFTSFTQLPPDFGKTPSVASVRLEPGLSTELPERTAPIENDPRRYQYYITSNSVLGDNGCQEIKTLSNKTVGYAISINTLATPVDQLSEPDEYLKLYIYLAHNFAIFLDMANSENERFYLNRDYSIIVLAKHLLKIDDLDTIEFYISATKSDILPIPYFHSSLDLDFDSFLFNTTQGHSHPIDRAIKLRKHGTPRYPLEIIDQCLSVVAVGDYQNSTTSSLLFYYQVFEILIGYEFSGKLKGYIEEKDYNRQSFLNFHKDNISESVLIKSALKGLGTAPSASAFIDLWNEISGEPRKGALADCVYAFRNRAVHNTRYFLSKMEDFSSTVEALRAVALQCATQEA